MPSGAVARYPARTDPTVRRKHVRRRLVRSAYLEAAGIRPIVCIVRDLSEGGARLRVPLGFEVTGPVVLYVPDLGWRRPLRIVWDLGHTIGVAFDGPAIAS